MTIAATLCIVFGSFPGQTVYALLPWDVDYKPYDVTHVLTQLQLLFFSALAFVWLNLKNMYPPELPSTNLDTDWLYRKLLPSFLLPCYYFVTGMLAKTEQSLTNMLKRWLNNSYDKHTDRPKGYFAQLWPTETMVLWVALLLAGMLILYYV